MSKPAMMQAHLDALTQTLASEDERTHWRKEFTAFQKLYKRHTASAQEHIDWNRIKPLNDGDIKPFSSLTEPKRAQIKEHLNKLVVVKLNGGLGTSMGCVGPKSIIEVRDGLTFLDMTVMQIQAINHEYGVKVPLVLMNSFNTHQDTLKIVEKYKDDVEIKTFNQSKFPRIERNTRMPLAKDFSDKSEWYPPGHGNIYESLHNSGLLDELVEAGKEYIFISNVDNLGATVSTSILNHFASMECDYIMEVTDKTMADVKGGTLVRMGDHVELLEIAQVAPQHVVDFKSIKKFKVFNTNNIWVKASAVKEAVENDVLELDIIVNNKKHNGRSIIQLETAVGSAMRFFKGAHGINVPRSRFLPVKKCTDLLLVKSGIYINRGGSLVRSSERVQENNPLIKFSTDHFKTVADFDQRFENMPNIVDLEHLTVAGDVYFGANVTLQGTVIIVASNKDRIDIPPGAILKDKIVQGGLTIIEH